MVLENDNSQIEAEESTQLNSTAEEISLSQEEVNALQEEANDLSEKINDLKEMEQTISRKIKEIDNLIYTKTEAWNCGSTYKTFCEDVTATPQEGITFLKNIQKRLGDSFFGDNMKPEESMQLSNRMSTLKEILTTLERYKTSPPEAFSSHFQQEVGSFFRNTKGFDDLLPSSFKQWEVANKRTSELSNTPEITTKKEDRSTLEIQSEEFYNQKRALEEKRNQLYEKIKEAKALN